MLTHHISKAVRSHLVFIFQTAVKCCHLCSLLQQILFQLLNLLLLLIHLIRRGDTQLIRHHFTNDWTIFWCYQLHCLQGQQRRCLTIFLFSWRRFSSSLSSCCFALSHSSWSCFAFVSSFTVSAFCIDTQKRSGTISEYEKHTVRNVLILWLNLYAVFYADIVPIF